MRLAELARVIRSKNAGPLTLTIDILFDDARAYERACTAASLSEKAIACLYGCEAAAVRIVPYPVALALKIALPRAITAGSPGDRDVYGAQQHAPLLGVEL